MPQASNICFSIFQRIAGKPSPISCWIIKNGKIFNNASCKSNFPTNNSIDDHYSIFHPLRQSFKISTIVSSNFLRVNLSLNLR